jgi:MoxR-like ATPase
MSKSVKELYLNVEKELNSFLFGYENEIRAYILGHLTKTNVALLGDPGIGKTFSATKFAEAFPTTGNAKSFFSVQLEPFSTPAKVFGPVDILKLKQGQYELRSEEFLPNSKIALLDELTRGKAVLDALLEIVNEKTYDVNGSKRQSELEMVITTTNFKFDSNHFEAMRDRFLQWMYPRKLDLNDRSLIKEYWRKTKKSATVTTKITEAQVAQARAEVQAIEVSEEAADAFLDILIELKTPYGIEISQRRHDWIFNTIVKAQAWLNGHTEVETEDLEIVWSALWSDETQIPTVQKVVRKYTNPEKELINSLFEGVQIRMQEWKTNPAANPSRTVAKDLQDMEKKLAKIKRPKPENLSMFNVTKVLIERSAEAVAAVIHQQQSTL